MKSKKEQYIQKYSLADIFDKTIKMIKHTWKDSIILSIVGFIPYAFVMGVALHYYIDAIINIVSRAQDMYGAHSFNWELFVPLLLAVGLLFLATLVFALAALFISACISLKTYKKAGGKDVGFKDNALYIFKNKFGTLLLQGLLFIAISIGLYVAYFIAVFILGLISMLIFNSPALPLIFAILLGLALLAVSVWLFIALSFSAQAVVIDDASVTGGLVRSFKLVTGNWWRVLGYNLLLGIVLSFAISLATFPVIMIFLLPIYIQIFESLLDNSGGTIDFQSLFNALRFIYIPLAIASFIQAIGYMLVRPVFTTLFYIDLKYRKGEFDTPKKAV
ncbi:MAG: hypothetical protein JW822_14225 [Spirochaetales bacterium]|nr:hypothetical protein [Spirochaetales bacterium]